MTIVYEKTSTIYGGTKPVHGADQDARLGEDPEARQVLQARQDPVYTSQAVRQNPNPLVQGVQLAELELHHLVAVLEPLEIVSLDHSLEGKRPPSRRLTSRSSLNRCHPALESCVVVDAERLSLQI